MIDHSELIARLRDWRGDPDEVMEEAATAIEALEAEKLAMFSKWEAECELSNQLRAQLAAAQGQRPYATVQGDEVHKWLEVDQEFSLLDKPVGTPVYLAAPIPQQSQPETKKTLEAMAQEAALEQAQPEHAPLSDDDIKALFMAIPIGEYDGVVSVARAIEAAHGIKQGGQQ